MTLLEEILAKCPPEMVQAKQCRQIADLVSEGRTRTVPVEVGHGVILEALGLADGNALLDMVYGLEEFRHVRPLLEQGRLQLTSPVVLGALQGFVNAQVVTQGNVDKLIALSQRPDPVSIEQVIQALEVL